MAHVEQDLREVEHVLVEPATTHQRVVRIAAILLGLAAAFLLLQAIGVNPIGWCRSLITQMGRIPPAYLVAGIATQTANLLLCGLAYVTVWRAAYPGSRTLPVMQIATCYAVSIALNGVLPLNLGTFAMLFMFLAILPGATAAGMASGYGVFQAFFAVVGVLTYAYLFVAISGALNEAVGGIGNHLPALIAILAVAVVGVAILLRVFRQKAVDALRKMKQGAAILGNPRRYLIGVLLLQVIAYGFQLANVGVFMAGYGIPVSLGTIVLNNAANSVATLTAVTPGGVGATQGVTALALHGVASPATIAAFSLTRQLVLTAWDLVFAAGLVLVFFGYKGGRQIITNSLVQARAEVSERREASRERKAGKRAAKHGAPAAGVAEAPATATAEDGVGADGAAPPGGTVDASPHG